MMCSKTGVTPNCRTQHDGSSCGSRSRVFECLAKLAGAEAPYAVVICKALLSVGIQTEFG
jgi:hypothetical protein